MRLKSSLWVAAYLRRAMLAGAFAAVVRHGDDDAGAVYVKIVLDRDNARLVGPAPVYALEPGEGRKWQHLAITADEIDAFLARQHGFDPDLWVVEIEDREGRDFFTETEIHEGE